LYQYPTKPIEWTVMCMCFRGIVSSPGPNIAITWCPSSVVCHPSSVNFSHFNLLLRNHWANWNQTYGIFLGWSSTKFLFYVPVGYSTWLPGLIICSDWLKFQRSSSLKLMNWLNLNCKWMIRKPRWLPQQDID
jgi:hypothetical protein